MQLSDIANVVCTKLNQLEAEDIVAAKLFATRRYEMIWQDQLWKDSVIDWTYTLPAVGTPYLATSQWLPTKQILILPAAFDKVLAARTGSRRMNVQSEEIFFRSDVDVFQNSGMMLDYLVLPPAVWDLDFLCFLMMTSDQRDAGKQVIADVADNGVTARDLVTLQANTLTVQIDNASRLDSLSKPVTSGKVLLGAAPVVINACAGQHTFTFFDSNSKLLATITLAVNASAVFPPAASIQTDGANGVNIAGFNGVITVTDVGGGGGGGGLVSGNFAYVLASPSIGSAFLTLLSTDTAATRRQRIQLIGSVDVPAPTIRVLGKAKPNTLSADTDSTMLTGVDNCLIAAVEYDMLQRQRQYGKAQIKMTEYAALLDQLKSQEVLQQAHNKRVIPEDGYGNPYDMWSHPPLSF